MTPEQITAGAPEAMHARVTLRDAMAPLLADGWKVTEVAREARVYTLSR